MVSKAAAVLSEGEEGGDPGPPPTVDIAMASSTNQSETYTPSLQTAPKLSPHPVSL